MFLKSVKTQLHFILRQRVTQAVFFLLMGLVGYNFVNNVLEFHGMDVSNMYHPMKLLTLSYNRAYYNVDVTLLFAQIYPLLVACPAGLILAKESQMKMNVLIESRIGKIRYFFSKGISVFFATMIVFTLPFLIEILLNVISFPMEANRDFSHFGAYEEKYIQMVRNYWFSELFRSSPYLYSIVMTILFGTISGLIGLMVMSFSAVFPVRFRVLYLILPFVLLNSTIYVLPAYTGGTLQHVWYKYIFLFGDGEKNCLVFAAILAVIVTFNFIAAMLAGKKDSV